MAFSLIPDLACRSIYDVDYRALADRGVKLVLADLDNTLIPYSQSAPTAENFRWRDELRALGIEVFILSNSRKSRRVPDYCAAFGVPYLRHAGKPHRAGFYKAMEQMGRKPEETVVLGDQMFTDCLGANIAGLRVVLVRPIAFENPFRAARYAIELPFRALARNRKEQTI